MNVNSENLYKWLNNIQQMTNKGTSTNSVIQRKDCTFPKVSLHKSMKLRHCPNVLLRVITGSVTMYYRLKT